MIGVAALLATGTGCSTIGELGEGDLALLAQDVQDVSREGTIFALAENPQWRVNVTLVRDQLNLLAANEVITTDSVLKIVQGLPLKELQSTEARLSITTVRITLRRAGRNVEIGNIKSIRPIVIGMATGITEGLAHPLSPHP